MKLNDLVYAIHEEYDGMIEGRTPSSSHVSQVINTVESIYTIITEGKSLIHEPIKISEQGYARVPSLLESVPYGEGIDFAPSQPEEEADETVRNMIQIAFSILPDTGIHARKIYMENLPDVEDNKGKILTTYGKILPIVEQPTLSLALHFVETVENPMSIYQALMSESSQHDMIAVHTRLLLARAIRIIMEYGTEVYQDA